MLIQRVEDGLIFCDNPRIKPLRADEIPLKSQLRALGGSVSLIPNMKQLRRYVSIVHLQHAERSLKFEICFDTPSRRLSSTNGVPITEASMRGSRVGDFP